MEYEDIEEGKLTEALETITKWVLKNKVDKYKFEGDHGTVICVFVNDCFGKITADAHDPTMN